MTERPILFSGEMVKAILDGRKTQTRRVVKPQPKEVHVGKAKEKRYVEVITLNNSEIAAPGSPAHIEECPYGISDDRLWVRETSVLLPNNTTLYRATDGERGEAWMMYGKPKWKPSIFMPRWASRITLEITNVRVERLQDITEEDAIKEGIQKSDSEGLRHWPYLGADHLVKGTPKVFPFARQAFSSLWDSINGKKHPWSSNPWCWVIEFNRVNA